MAQTTTTTHTTTQRTDTPPYSKDITQSTQSTTTTQTQTDPNVTIQPAQVIVQPAPTTPGPTINVQTPPAQENITITPPAQQPEVPPPVIDQRPVNVNVVSPERPAPQMAVSIGGGVSEFSDAAIRDRTGVNGEYEARLHLGIQNPLGFEAAYVGTAVGLQGLAGGSNAATLLSNGVEGLARLNLGNRMIQPFAVGGASWVHYSVVDKAVSLSDVRNNDDVLAIPFGAGVASYIPDSGFMIDARFIYRATFNDDLMKPTATNSGPGLSNWNVSLRLGYAF